MGSGKHAQGWTHRVAAWAAAVSLGACTLDSSGTGAGAGKLDDETEAGGTTTQPLPDATSLDPDADTSGNDTAMSGAATSGAGSQGSTSLHDETTGALTTGGGGPWSLPVSCAAILQANANAVSGIYEIDPTGGGQPIDVYCDMSTAGGGWILVARSVNGDHDAGMFGWSAGRGSPDDFSIPYSLDVRGVGLTFTELLVGNRNQGVTWGDRVYRLTAPADFLDHTDDAIDTPSIETLLGDCDPSGGPTMLRRIGHTGSTNVFFFRDMSDYDTYGLQYDGWDTYWNLTFPCSYGADLDGDQGMIMVR